jgi:chemotaxis protein methyltransferase CheR
MSKSPKAPTLKREFAFSDQEFKLISQLIYARAGIHLTLSKKDMVYGRIARRLRTLNLDSFSDYLARIESDDVEEREAFVNALTTNVTSFFREAHHFKTLAEHVSKIKRRPINIWCNAASTGQEPYSIAMTMMDLFDSLTPPVQIIATDIDTVALQKAQQGVYSDEDVSKLPKAMLARYFLKGRANNAGSVKVRQELRDIVSFSQINLLDDDWPMQGPFDAVFCRNVMIYFDKATQCKILLKFIPTMQQDALMFAGHSESLHNTTTLFELHEKTVYKIAKKAKPLAAFVPRK